MYQYYIIIYLYRKSTWSFFCEFRKKTTKQIFDKQFTFDLMAYNEGWGGKKGQTAALLKYIFQKNFSSIGNGRSWSLTVEGAFAWSYCTIVLTRQCSNLTGSKRDVRCYCDRTVPRTTNKLLRGLRAQPTTAVWQVRRFYYYKFIIRCPKI